MSVVNTICFCYDYVNKYKRVEMKYKTDSFFVYILPILSLYFNLQAKTVQGIVIDVKTNEPIKSVVVMIIDTANVICAMQNTDSTGVFNITGIKHDRIIVRTYRLGYVSTTTGPYNLALHDTLKMVIRLEAIPIVLKEAVVTAKKIDPYLERAHFYERKKMGMGHYVTWDDFKDRGLSSVYDILRGIPGVIVRGENISLARYSASSIGSTATQPLIYVDGILMPNETANVSWRSPENVQAVEVYNGINAPQQYSRGKQGGVKLIWTRH